MQFKRASAFIPSEIEQTDFSDSQLKEQLRLKTMRVYRAISNINNKQEDVAREVTR